MSATMQPEWIQCALVKVPTILHSLEVRFTMLPLVANEVESLIVMSTGARLHTLATTRRPLRGNSDSSAQGPHLNEIPSTRRIQPAYRASAPG
jgi:hypothetical protein